MIWMLGPSAILLAIVAFAVVIAMSVFGAGAVLAWLRRRRPR